MANPRWRGTALKTIDVWSTVVSAYHASTLYEIGISGTDKYVSAIAEGDVTATATALASAWQASTEPEHAEVTVSSDDDTIYFTMNEPGVPTLIDAVATGGTGTIGAPSNDTPATGPNFWDNDDNWDTGTAPTTGDSAYVDGDLPPIKYGLDNSSDTLAALYVFGNTSIGLPSTNPSGYSEFRTTHLTIGATLWRVNTRSGMVYLNFGTVAYTGGFIEATGQPESNELPACHIRGTSSSNVLNVLSGDWGIAIQGGTTSKATTLNIGTLSNSAGSPPTGLIGAGVTLSTVSHVSGRTLCFASAPNPTIDGGEFKLDRAAAVSGTATARDEGKIIFNGSGTVANITCGPGGYCDLSQVQSALTISNTVQLHTGASWDDPYSRCTAAYKLNQCRVSDLAKFEIGINKTLTPS